MRSSCCYPAILIFAAVCCGNTRGQNDFKRELYGNGVHAFNAGRLSEASQHLEAAIAQGSQDPRVYYFLGLTKLQGGDVSGAEADFSKAATFEFQGRGTYDVGMALSRVQGQSRMRLENVRRETKITLRPAPRALPAQATEPAPRIAPLPYDEAPAAFEPPVDLPTDDPTDPFADDPDPTAPTDDAQDPFGADVELNDDPFAPQADIAPGGDEPTGEAHTGAASAVMRALFNAGRKAVPKPTIPSIPGQMPGSGVLPPNDLPAATEMTEDAADPLGAGDDDLFADDGDDPFADDGDDPFAPDQGTGAEADSAAAPTAPAAEDAADAFGPGDDDPFADDGETSPPPTDEPAPATDDAGDPADTADDDLFGGDDPFADDGS